MKAHGDLAKLILPIYFAVTILQHIPFLHYIAQLFHPVLGLAGISGKTALALIMGAFFNIYAGTAVFIPLIPSLPLDIQQLTELAPMSRICHSTETTIFLGSFRCIAFMSCICPENRD